MSVLGDSCPDSGYYSQPRRISRVPSETHLVTPMSRSESTTTNTSVHSTQSSSSKDYNTRVITAKRIFKRLSRQYDKTIMPSKDDIDKLNSFADVITEKLFLSWIEEFSSREGIEFGLGMVMFEQFAESPHDDIVGGFVTEYLQVNPGRPSSVFYSEGTRNIILPGYGVKQPDWQWRPTDQQGPGPFSSFLHQPGTNNPWPTVVLEVGRRQTQPDLMELMRYYLSNSTQINVFIGVKVYFDTATNLIPTRWWMGVYIRNIHPSAPSAILPGPLPAPGPICIGQLSHPRHELLTIPQNITWRVPVDVLFHPIPIPPNPPSAPAGFFFQPLAIDVEYFRQIILMKR